MWAHVTWRMCVPGLKYVLCNTCVYVMYICMYVCKRLLDTWDRNGSTSGPTPWEIDDDDDDDDDDVCMYIHYVLHMYVNMYACMHVYVYIYICIYIYIYIHTHICCKMSGMASIAPPYYSDVRNYFFFSIKKENKLVHIFPTVFNSVLYIICIAKLLNG